MTAPTVRRQENVAGGRPREVRVGLTEEQYAELLRRSEAERITISKLLVQTVLGTPEPSIRAMVFELMAWRRLLQTLADMLYQLALQGEVEGYDVYAHDEAVVAVNSLLTWVAEQLEQLG